MNTCAFGVLVGLLGGLPVLAQAPADASSRLVAAVQASGLAHERSTSGKSLVLAFDLEGGRRQQVFLTLAPGQVDGLVVHTIYTAVWVGKEPPDPALVRRLVGSAKKFGTFYVYRDSQGTWSIRFSAQFDATALPAEPKAAGRDVQQLHALLEFVATVGGQTVAALAKEAGR